MPDPELGIAVRDDWNRVHGVVWHGTYSFGWSPLWPGEIDVRDGATVVATTGRRYLIGGRDHTDRFWACANVFIPHSTYTALQVLLILGLTIALGRGLYIKWVRRFGQHAAQARD